jgi:hypothetical protein
LRCEGVENVNLKMIKILKSMGFEVHILTYEDDSDRWKYLFEETIDFVRYLPVQ